VVEIPLDARRGLEFAQHFTADVQRDRPLCPVGKDARAHAHAGPGIEDGREGAVRSSRHR